MSPIDSAVNNQLQNYLRDREPLAIALSGGIDSSTLALFCHQNNVAYTSFTVTGQHITDFETQKVMHLREEYGLNHIFFYYDYSSCAKVIENSRDRCFHCKSFLLSGPASFFSTIFTLADGTNYTEARGHRPGIRALTTLGFISPFLDLKIDKGDVIDLARQLGLKADANDSRSCILSRFNYGVCLDSNVVLKIRQAENFLLEHGMTGFRLRVPSPGKYLLQIDFKQRLKYEHYQSDFNILIKQLDLSPLEVQFMPFAEITGFYD